MTVQSILTVRLKKILIYTVMPIMISSCAPLIPDNYLGPNTIRTAQKVDGNGKWVAPRVIPISAKMLNTPEGQALLAPAMQLQSYRIGVFDNLNVIVWGHPEVSTIPTSTFSLPSGVDTSALNMASTANPSILVQTDGTIFFPYAGHIKVAGLTVNEVQTKISRKLSRYIRNPQVTVQIAKFRNRNIYVSGAVMSQGMQPLTDKPLTLMEAITSAGGINPSVADPTHIYVVRGSYLKPDIFWLDAQTPQALLMAEQFLLQENDHVYVSAATLTSWNSFINTILPNLSYYASIRGATK